MPNYIHEQIHRPIDFSCLTYLLHPRPSLEQSRTHGFWGVGVASPWKIAYTELQAKSPQSVPRVIALLKKHPDYVSKWQSQINTVPQGDSPKGTLRERDLYLFMLATRWADDARKTTEDRPTWHYVNFPFKLGSTATTIPASPTGEENILTALQQNRTLLAAPGTTPTKVIALTWIFHLVDDIHQPLHTTKAVSTQFPLPIVLVLS